MISGMAKGIFLTLNVCVCVCVCVVEHVQAKGVVEDGIKLVG